MELSQGLAFNPDRMASSKRNPRIRCSCNLWISLASEVLVETGGAHLYPLRALGFVHQHFSLLHICVYVCGRCYMEALMLSVEYTMHELWTFCSPAVIKHTRVELCISIYHDGCDTKEWYEIKCEAKQQV